MCRLISGINILGKSFQKQKTRPNTKPDLPSSLLLITSIKKAHLVLQTSRTCPEKSLHLLRPQQSKQTSFSFSRPPRPLPQQRKQKTKVCLQTRYYFLLTLRSVGYAPRRFRLFVHAKINTQPETQT